MSEWGAEEEKEVFGKLLASTLFGVDLDIYLCIPSHAYIRYDLRKFMDTFNFDFEECFLFGNGQSASGGSK